MGRIVRPLRRNAPRRFIGRDVKMAKSANHRAYHPTSLWRGHAPWVCWLVIAVSLGTLGFSQEPGELETQPTPPATSLPLAEATTDLAPLRFRRVFVPKDVLDQVRDPVPYFPLNAAEFEKMIAAANRQVVFRGQHARIVTAIYRANVRDHDLVGLEGEWLVELFHGTSAILPLGKLNIGLSDPVWVDLGGAPVSLLSDQEGNVSLYVERSGKVGFRWSAHGQTVGAGGSIGFDLTFPPAIRTELELYTSDRFDVAAEGGLVFPMSSSSGGLAGYRLIISDPSRFGMVLQPRRPPAQPVPRGDYREEIAYELTLQGLEATWQWSIDVVDSPLEGLKIRVPQHVRIMEISLGDVALPWEYIQRNDSLTDTIRVRFPEPLTGHNRRVTLRGLTSLQLDGPIVLPTLALEGLFWRSGVSTVIVRMPLAIQDVKLRSARLRDVRTLSAGPLGTVLEVVHDTSGADMTLFCRLTAPKVDETTVVVTKITPSEVQAEVRSALRSDGDGCFELTWPISPAWTILDVSSSDQSLLAGWQFRPGGDKPSKGGALTVRLKKSLPTDKPALLRMRLRRDPPTWDHAVLFDEMIPLVASAMPSTAHLYAALILDPAMAAGRTIEVEPDVEPIGPVELTSLANLYETGSSLQLFDLSELDVKPKVRLVPRQFRYQAQINGKIEINGENLLQSFRVTIEPDQTGVNELCVFWSEVGVDRQFDWFLIESEGRETPLSVSEQSFGPCHNIKTSVVSLPKTMQGPFVVKAQRRTALQPGPIPLLLLPNATHYEALITIIGDARSQSGPTAFGEWRASGLQLVDRTAALSETGQPTVASYRYWGTADGGPASIFRLELVSHETGIPGGTWASRGIVAIRLDASGLLERWHIFEMKGTLQEELVFRRSVEEPLPEKMIVLVDEEQASFQTASDEKGPSLRIHIPSGRQPQRLTIWERFSRPSFFIVCPLRVRQLEPAFPVKEWQTSVWLPPVYEALRVSEFHDWGVYWQDWAVRLFGPLKRPPDQPLFLPDRINRMIFDPSLPPPNLAMRRAIQFQEELGKHLQELAEITNTSGLQSQRQTLSPASASVAEDLPAGSAMPKSTPAATKTGKSILWRDLLSDSFLDRVHNLPPGIRTVAFLVDLAALKDLGIQPVDPIPLDDLGDMGQFTDPALKAEKFLTHHSLTIVVTQSAVLLTSLATTASHRNEVQWTNPPIYKLDSHSQWWQEIERAVAAGDGRRYCRIRLWNDLPATVQPTTNAGADPGIAFAAQGWNATAVPQAELEGNEFVTLMIFRNDTLQATRWLGLLVAFFAAWLGGFQRRFRIVTASLVFAVVVLFVPPPFVPLASGFFLGSLLALAASLLVGSSDVKGKGQPIDQGPSPQPQTSGGPLPAEPVPTNLGKPQPSGTSLISVGIVAIFLCCFGDAKSFATSPEAPEPPPTLLSQNGSAVSHPAEDRGPSRGSTLGALSLIAQTTQLPGRESSATTPPGVTAPGSATLPPPYRVFIPVDETGKPVGQEVYVPEGLYKELQKRTSPTTAKPSGWHFGSATYRGTLAATPAGDRWELSQLTANFEVWVVDAPTQLQIPLGSAEAVPQLTDILLDGRPIVATWDQSRLQVNLPESGRYRIQVPIALTPRIDAGTSEVRLRIPSVANTRLELAAPFAVNRIEVPSARGRVESDPESGRWTAELGAISELVIRWPASSDPLSDTGPQADILYRLRLGPSQATWELRWKFHLNNAQIDQLQVLCEPSLRLDQASADSQVRIETLVADSDRQILQMGFDSPLKDEGTLMAVFTEPLPTGSGGLRLPDVQLMGIRIARRTLFIQAHPGVSLDVRESSGWRLADLVTESKRWGIPPGEVGEVYEYLGGPMFWGAWVQPQPVRPTMDEHVQLLATQDEILMRWQARFTSSGGISGCHRVRIPEGFSVRKVAVITGATEQPYPWSVSDDQTLLLLTDRLGPDSQLLIEGRLSLPLSEDWHLQRPTLADAEVQNLTVMLFRAPNVFVEVTKHVGLELVSSVQQPTGDQQLGVFLNAYAARQPQAVDLTLRIQANQPQITAEQFIRVTEAGNRLQAEIRLDVTIINGFLQELKLDLPPQWQIGPAGGERTASPLELKTEWGLTNAGPAGYETGRVKKRLTFAAPQKDTASVALLGSPTLDDHGCVPIPWIGLSEVSSLRSYLIVPKRLEWPSDLANIYGLRPVPQEELKGINIKADETAYELTQTMILPHIVGKPSPDARWEDAEIRIQVSPEGHILGLLTVWFTSSPAEGYQIQMPKGIVPVNAWLDHRCVPVYQRPDGTTHIATDTVKDHRLDLLFAGSVARRGQSLSLALPQLKNAEKAESGRVYLLLQGASSWNPSLAPGEPVTAWDYHLTRAREAAERLLQLSEGAAGPAPPQGTFGELLKQYLLARDEARRALLLAPQTAAISYAEVRLQNLELQVSDLLQSAVGIEATLASPGAIAGETLGDALPSSDMQSWYFECEDLPTQIRLQQTVSAQKWGDLLIGSVVIFAVGSIGWLIRRINRPLSVWMMRFAHPLAVLFGIGWWLWLRPSFVGWLLILAALILLIRSRWQWVPKEDAIVPLIVQQKLPTTGSPR